MWDQQPWQRLALSIASNYFYLLFIYLFVVVVVVVIVTVLLCDRMAYGGQRQDRVARRRRDDEERWNAAAPEHTGILPTAGRRDGVVGSTPEISVQCQLKRLQQQVVVRQQIRYNIVELRSAPASFHGGTSVVAETAKSSF